MRVYFERPIGDGTCADVWLGTDEIGRSVAIKVLRQEGREVSTLLQHAQALVRAKHPHVVEVYSIEKLPVPDQVEEQCIVMEYVNGITLAQRLAADIKLRDAFYIGRSILSGVQHIHSQGLAHMDLHNENILITKEGDVKIIDIMYTSSLSNFSEKVRLNHLDLDIRSLVEILGQLIEKSPFGEEARSYFLNSIGNDSTLDSIKRNYLDIFTVVTEDIEDIVTLFKVIPFKLKLYKFRAECEIDVDSLEKVLGGDAVSIVKSKQYFPDVRVNLVTALTLDEVRQRMRKIVDSHVMIQTVAHHSDYTGERDYELE